MIHMTFVLRIYWDFLCGWNCDPFLKLFSASWKIGWVIYSLSQKSVCLQELGKRTKCEQEVSFKEEVILIQRGQRTGVFQYRLKARHYARHFACIILFQGEAGFFRAGNGPPGRLSNFLKSVACWQPLSPLLCWARSHFSFKTHFKHHLF